MTIPFACLFKPLENSLQPVNLFRFTTSVAWYYPSFYSKLYINGKTDEQINKYRYTLHYRKKSCRFVNLCGKALPFKSIEKIIVLVSMFSNILKHKEIKLPY